MPAVLFTSVQQAKAKKLLTKILDLTCVGTVGRSSLLADAADSKSIP
jgi:hypothetical protein